jgi:hypothetical protein
MTEEAELAALHAISSLASGTDDPGVATREILASSRGAFRVRDSGTVAFQNPETGSSRSRRASACPPTRPLVRPGQGVPGLGRLAREAAPGARLTADLRSRPAPGHALRDGGPLLLADGPRARRRRARPRPPSGRYGAGDLAPPGPAGRRGGPRPAPPLGAAPPPGKARQLEALIATGQALVGKLEQRELFDTLTRDALGDDAGRACAFFLYDYRGGEPAPRLVHGRTRETLRPRATCRCAPAWSASAVHTSRSPSRSPTSSRRSSTTSPTCRATRRCARSSPRRCSSRAR